MASTEIEMESPEESSDKVKPGCNGFESTTVRLREIGRIWPRCKIQCMDYIISLLSLSSLNDIQEFASVLHGLIVEPLIKGFGRQRNDDRDVVDIMYTN